MTKRARKKEEDGRRRRGRLEVRWADSVKRDLERAEVKVTVGEHDKGLWWMEMIH